MRRGGCISISGSNGAGCSGAGPCPTVHRRIRPSGGSPSQRSIIHWTKRLWGEIRQGQHGAGEMRIWDRRLWVPLGGAGDGGLGGAQVPAGRRAAQRRLDAEERAEGQGGVAAYRGVRPGGGAEVSVMASPLPRRLPPGKPGPLPKKLRPHLPTSAELAPVGDAWLQETKYCGDRTLVRIDGDAVRPVIRQGLDWTERHGRRCPPTGRSIARRRFSTGRLWRRTRTGRGRSICCRNASRTSAIRSLSFAPSILSIWIAATWPTCRFGRQRRSSAA